MTAAEGASGASGDMVADKFPLSSGDSHPHTHIWEALIGLRVLLMTREGDHEVERETGWGPLRRRWRKMVVGIIRIYCINV